LVLGFSFFHFSFQTSHNFHKRKNHKMFIQPDIPATMISYHQSDVLDAQPLYYCRDINAYLMPHEAGGTQVCAVSVEHAIADAFYSRLLSGPQKRSIRYVIDRVREGAFVSEQLMLPTINHPDVRCTVMTWLLIHGDKERIDQVDVHDAVMHDMGVDLLGSLHTWSDETDTVSTTDSLNDFIVDDVEVVYLEDTDNEEEIIVIE
jgi:hypothetical protein